MSNIWFLSQNIRFQWWTNTDMLLYTVYSVYIIFLVYVLSQFVVISDIFVRVKKEKTVIFIVMQGLLSSP